MANYFKKKAIVLIYHRVIDLENDPQQLAVSAHNFENQIQIIKKKFKIIRLQDLITNLKSNEIIDNSVIITFDDGYSDNYEFALPILEKYQVPATFFISTGYVGSKNEFWWDKLEPIFLSDSKLPSNLELKIGSVIYRWTNCYKNGHLIYEELLGILKRQSFDIIQSTLEQLSNWIGLNYNHREQYRALNADELIKLSQNPMFEIGSHTINHCILANESQEIQQREISDSKLFLEKLINVEIHSFSYPFGKNVDFSNLTSKVVKESGYNCAISNIQGLVTKKTDIYNVPRFLVRNWTQLEFESKINDILRFGPE
jgi:peptidoglycan/xylan/chitin deacetylase (PgdA/CDA1 family)